MMSGLDEQTNIPMCPKCEKVPNFWVLQSMKEVELGSLSDRWIWLIDEHYTGRIRKIDGPRIRFIGEPVAVLSDVEVVSCCIEDNIRHAYFMENDVFHEVLTVATREEANLFKG